MSKVNDKSLKQKILSFLEIKEGLIKSISGRSYLDYAVNVFYVLALIIPAFIYGFEIVESHYVELGFGIYFSSIILWILFRKYILFDDEIEMDSIESGTYEDLSFTEEKLPYIRILSFIGAFIIIGLAVFIISHESYEFETLHIFFYLIAAKWCLYLFINAYYKVTTDTKIFKIESDRLRISYDKAEKYVLLKELKQIKIAGTHLSFFPMEGKIEMLNDFELDEKEQLQIKGFLNEHMPEISVSIYETRLEIFKDNKQEN
ncbi:hypothetical protein LX97_02254 [Nonlabens dokdonensis]|jgi:hypothetical protein|uniref:Uncharacterized protein n=2 Tax=Nonlabens dokdonensis TaxID=328515 RepID=L7W786_NONDD|nr:hypothetical protein [Nonlabens dokdonensis]AGC77550.1 hypothetical protein DDD_2423 [Nonlabens dokdonensis DSW-6]PZX39896.1 hypothetical protein LX97_02254 [Nonlabens dokdonensis]